MSAVHNGGCRGKTKKLKIECSTQRGLWRTPLIQSSMKSSASLSPGDFDLVTLSLSILSDHIVEFIFCGKQVYGRILPFFSHFNKTKELTVCFFSREDTKGKVLRLTLLDHDREGKRLF